MFNSIHEALLTKLYDDKSNENDLKYTILIMLQSQPLRYLTDKMCPIALLMAK